MKPKQLVVNVEVYAHSIGDRLYAFFALTFLGLAIAIMGKGGATIKSGDEIKITIDKPIRKKRTV